MGLDFSFEGGTNLSGGTMAVSLPSQVELIKRLNLS